MINLFLSCLTKSDKAYLYTFLTTIIFCSPLTVWGQTYLDEMQKKWANSSDYLMDLAEAMPDSLYDFKPTEEEMTFREQLLHICGNMINMGSEKLGYKSLDIPVAPSKHGSPVALRKYIRLALDFAGEAINAENDSSLNEMTPFFEGPMTHRQIINLMNDHLTHHRGQLIVYLRLNGITPRRYVGW